MLFPHILWSLLAALLATLLGRRSSSVVGGGGSVGGCSVGVGLGLLGHGQVVELPGGGRCEALILGDKFPLRDKWGTRGPNPPLSS